MEVVAAEFVGIVAVVVVVLVVGVVAVGFANIVGAAVKVAVAAAAHA